MKTIKLLMKSNGKRTMVADVHGFEGPAQAPMNGKGILIDGGDYLKRGEITGHYTLMVPPSGICEVVDTQFNRVKLRTGTKPRQVWEEIPRYIPETGKTVKERKELTLPPAWEVTDGTDVFEDIEVMGEEVFTKAQVEAMIADALEAKKTGTKTKKTKTKVNTGPTRKGVVAEENLQTITPTSDRFAHKVMPTNRTPIKGTKATPNLAPAEA